MKPDDTFYLGPHTATVWLIWIGPQGHVMSDDEGRTTELVAGRRYQMDAALAAYRVEHDVNHWKRPDLPKASAGKD